MFFMSCFGISLSGTYPWRYVRKLSNEITVKSICWLLSVLWNQDGQSDKYEEPIK